MITRILLLLVLVRISLPILGFAHSWIHAYWQMALRLMSYLPGLTYCFQLMHLNTPNCAEKARLFWWGVTGIFGTIIFVDIAIKNDFLSHIYLEYILLWVPKCQIAIVTIFHQFKFLMNYSQWNNFPTFKWAPFLEQTSVNKRGFLITSYTRIKPYPFIFIMTVASTWTSASYSHGWLM